MNDNIAANFVDEAASTNSTVRQWWLYLLRCTDGRTYVGIALDVETRFKAHLTGKGAKFTRSNLPVAILGAQPFDSRSAVQHAEYALKQLGRSERLQWAKQWPYPPLAPY
jgi:putative endonuclease